MNEKSKQILRTLANVATDSFAIETYSRAAGDTVPQVSKKERLAQLLERFGSGNSTSILTSYTELKQILTPNDREETKRFERMWRSHLFCVETKESLRIKLLEEFEQRKLERKDLRRLLFSLSVLVPHLQPDFTQAVQELLVRRIGESYVLAMVCEIVREEDGYHSADIVLALRIALRSPVVAVACLRAAAEGAENTRVALTRSLTAICEEEARSVDIAQQYILLCASAPVTKVLLDEMLGSDETC